MKRRLGSSLLVAFALTSCTTVPAPAPSVAPDASAAKFTERSLRDAGLHGFLSENLGHEPETWDFEALSWVAFYYNPSLAVARAQWATTRAARQTAAARPNPTLSLVPGYNSTREPGVSPWFPAINFDFLLQGDKRARQQDIAQADAEAARLGVLASAWQVRSDLRRAIIELYAATNRERTFRELAVIQQQLATLYAQRFALGQPTSSEASVAPFQHIGILSLEFHVDKLSRPLL